MKILLISNTSWSVYNFRLELMKALKEKGAEVKFCAPKDNYTKKIIKRGYDFKEIKLDRGGFNPFRDLRTIYQLYRIYKKENPEVVLHYQVKPNIYGAIAAKLAGIHCINTVSGLGSSFVTPSLLTHFVKFLYRISFRFPDKVFFQNQDDLQLFVKGKLVNKEKTGWVPGSGVNTKKFSPEFCNSGGNRQDFVFLFMGRLLYEKGVEQLIKASNELVQEYDNVKVWLLGFIDQDNPSGIPLDEIKKWNQLPHIKYLGKTDDTRKYLCKANCVVLPSYREGVSRSLLEAASMEKILITTDTVGCREVVEEGKNGFLVKPKDVNSLVKAMKAVKELPEGERIKMKKAGRKKMIREFSIERVVDKYLKAIKELCPSF